MMVIAINFIVDGGEQSVPRRHIMRIRGTQPPRQDFREQCRGSTECFDPLKYVLHRT
jgi:hypothetical protein